MTRLFRTGLLLACVTLLSSWGWAQAPQFEGFAPGMGVQYNFGRQPYQPMPVEPELLPRTEVHSMTTTRCSIWNSRTSRAG